MSVAYTILAGLIVALAVYLAFGKILRIHKWFVSLFIFNLSIANLVLALLIDKTFFIVGSTLATLLFAFVFISLWIDLINEEEKEGRL